MDQLTSKSGSKAVYTVIDRPGNRGVWIRIGWASFNRDGSLGLRLDALPINGKLQVRDWQPREDRLAAEPPVEGEGSAFPAPDPMIELGTAVS